MRLDLELPSAPASAAEPDFANRVELHHATEAKELLSEGIKAAQAGNRPKARASLLRAVELDPRSESGWLWLASISEYPEELLVFLNNVLDINPGNSRALEWAAATKSLLSKTFVQRGIDAVDEKKVEYASQCFNQALEYDQNNSMAWLWLASLSDSIEGKIAYFEQVLAIDPENETAVEGFRSARYEISQRQLAEARAAAVGGRSAEANEFLDAIIAENPDSEDAWILRAHLADNFVAKIDAYERVLALNPGNVVARSGVDSLRAIIETVNPSAVNPSAVKRANEPVMEETTEAAEIVSPGIASFADVVSEKSPTQDLELLAGFVPPSSTNVDAEVVQAVAEVEPEVIESPVFEAQAGGPFSELAEPAETFEPALDPGAEEFAYNSEPTYFEAPQPYEDRSETAPPAMAVEDDQRISQSGDVLTGREWETEFVQPQADEKPDVEQDYQNGHAEVVEEYVDTYHAEEVVEEYVDTYRAEEAKNESSSAEMVAGAEADSYNSYEADPFAPTPRALSRIDDFSSALGYQSDLMPVGVSVVSVAGAGNTFAHVAFCPFCNGENDAQAVACQTCLAILTLSDLEMLINNHGADNLMLRDAVERMERERLTREFTETELTMLGIGHLNLRNLQYGYNYLQQASYLNPNNVILGSQVNALHIRLEEIKGRDEAQGTMPKGKRILVVDDSPTVRKLISGKLEKCGHEVVCSSDGVEAIERLEQMVPDLVLLDITMPRMDGYQVCKSIRSNPATKDVPVVMISGKDGFFDKVRGRMAGTTGYITKPFGPETLMKAVETYLSCEEKSEVIS